MRFLVVTTFFIALAVAKGEDEVARSGRRRPTTSSPTVTSPSPFKRDVAAEGPVGGWIASGGIGLFIDPSLFLMDAQLEYVMKPHLMVGPLVQLGLGNGTIFTVSGTARLLFGHHPKIKPSVEVGLGLAVVGGSVGVHIPIGIGVDYKIEPGIHVGTILRGNFMPPAKTFSISWPLLMGRFAI